jgi:hypothetical protein
MTRGKRKSNVPRGKKGDAYEAMDQAYDDASDGGRLPVPARNMYYAVRRILLRDGKECPTAHQFMNGKASILNCYLREHSHTDTWDILRDARGTFVPPHGEDEIPLSTEKVREYVADLARHTTDIGYLGFDLSFPKSPREKFAGIMYIEKEGFGPMIAAAGVQDRYDLAICSSKGYGIDAAKDILVACWRRFRVPILIAHDFDKDGINIAWQIENEGIPVIRLGLRWDDLHDRRWGLLAMSEPVEYMATGGAGKPGQPSDPRPLLTARGATPEEIDFLCDTADPGVEFSGERVELNALVGSMFIDWLEAKLKANKIGKVKPDVATLEAAWRRAYEIEWINQRIAEMRDEAAQAAQEAIVPNDLETQVSEALMEDDTCVWDDVVAELVEDEFDGVGP